MLSINLLPWRETEHLTKSKNFKMQLLAAFIGGIGLVLIWQSGLFYAKRLFFVQQKDLATQRAILVPQITEIMQLKKTQATLTHALKLHQKTIAEQATLNQLLLDLSHLPPTITLVKFQKNDFTIVLQGYSKSAAALNNLWLTLTKLPNLASLPVRADSVNSTFTFNFNLK